jgi:hypothetical protein
MGSAYCSSEMDEKSTAILMEDRREETHLGDMRLDGE